MATLRKVAASVRNAASLAGSLTFECSITLETPSRGKPWAGPMSIRPGGAIRRASGATAKSCERGRDDGGDAAADKGLAPGDAGFIERADRDRAHPARRRQGRQLQAFAAPPCEARRSEPAIFVFGEFLAAAPAAFLPHDDRIDPAGIVGIQEIARKADGHRERKLRRHRVQPLQQRHQFGPRRVIRDPERQLLAGRMLSRQCAVVRLDQRPRPVGKCCAVGGQADRARRALDQPLAKHGLEALQLHADRSLRGAERFGGAGEAAQFGHQQEGLHR